MLKDDFPDALPEVSRVIHPDRRHGKVFLLEAFVTLESEAQRSGGQSQQPEGGPEASRGILMYMPFTV